MCAWTDCACVSVFLLYFLMIYFWLHKANASGDTIVVTYLIAKHANTLNLSLTLVLTIKSIEQFCLNYFTFHTHTHTHANEKFAKVEEKCQSNRSIPRGMQRKLIEERQNEVEFEFAYENCVGCAKWNTIIDNIINVLDKVFYSDWIEIDFELILNVFRSHRRTSNFNYKIKLSFKQKPNEKLS